MKLVQLAAVIIVALSLSACKSSAVKDTLPWETNLETALATAKKENKAVLVNFTGSDWCMWCKKLNEEVFSKKEFADYAAEKLILVKIDFPKDIEQTVEQKMYNRELAQRFNIEGYPTIVLLNNQGSITGVTGYQPGGPENYVQHLKTMVQ